VVSKRACRILPVEQKLVGQAPHSLFRGNTDVLYLFGSGFLFRGPLKMTLQGRISQESLRCVEVLGQCHLIKAFVDSPVA